MASVVNIMKAKLFSLIALISVVTSAFGASQTAPARMYCLSVKVGQGVNAFGDAITLNYAARPDSADELGPEWPMGHHEIVLPAEVFTYNSNLDLWDDTYGYSSYGLIHIGLPVDVDANGNRFPDFFEVSRATSVTTSGSFSYWDPYTGAGSGSISGQWTRSAGQKAGTYAMTLFDYELGDWWGTMRGTFEILEYTGTITYTPATNSVSATVTLAQTGASANTFQGPIQFVKDPADWANTLTNLPGSWLNGSAQTCVFTNEYFFRNPSYPTNYAGYIVFDDDGDEYYTAYGYAIWVLSINDTHDTDGDGIPDFSDIPSATAPPRRPTISLARTSTNLLFTIHGDINHLHEIQQVPVITSSNWQPVVSVTLTNDPQVVPVAFPTGSTFYRVRAQ